MKNVSPAKDIRKLKGLKPTTTSREGKKKTSVELTVSSQEKKVGFLLIFVILMITLVIYLPSLKNGFVNLDDPDYVTENTRIRKLDQQHLKTIFTTFQNANYHPLTTLTNAVEFSIGGDQSAKLFHVNNLLLHLMNVLLVFWFTRTLLRNQYVAAVVALLFAIHPMHVESVVWVSERKDVLYTFFFFLSLNCYLSYLQAKGIQGKPRLDSAKNQDRKQAAGMYVLMLLFFLLSLLSKSAAVVLPLVMLLTDFLLKRKFTIHAVAEKIPFFALSLLFGILAMQSQKNAIQVDYGTLVTPVRRFFLVNWGFLRYVDMMIFPRGLAAFHTYPDLTGGKFPAMVYISPLINLIFLSLAIYSLRYTRIIFFGVVFFIITILLVLQILPVGGALIAERYTYVPYVGLFLILAYYSVSLVEKKGTPAIRKIIIVLLFASFTVGFMISTYNRIPVWKNALTLWQDVVEKYPGQNYNSYYQLGTALKKNNQPEEALEAFNFSLKLKPSALTYNNRGNIFNSRKQYDLALSDYEAALKLDSTLHTAYNNRGVIEATAGDYEKALRDFSKAISLKPDYTDAFRNRGQVKQIFNDVPGAVADWKIAADFGDEQAASLLKGMDKSGGSNPGAR